jgi:hypothetical protein
MRQPGRFGLYSSRKSLAAGSVRVVSPKDFKRKRSELRTPSSSTTTNTVGVAAYGYRGFVGRRIQKHAPFGALAGGGHDARRDLG